MPSSARWYKAPTTAWAARSSCAAVGGSAAYGCGVPLAGKAERAEGGTSGTLVTEILGAPQRETVKEKLVKCVLAPRFLSAPAPRESAIKPVPRPAAPVGKPSQTRRHHLTPPPVRAEGHCTGARLTLFSLDRARPVSLLARQKRNGGCIPAGQAPCGSRIPPGRRSAAPPHPTPGAFAQPSPWLNPCVQWDAPPGGIYGQTS